MSELLTVTAEVAPYLSTFFGALGGAVATTAVQRVADGTVDAGEGFLRRLVPWGDRTDPELLDEEEEHRADDGLSRLDENERRQLAGALTQWLEEAEEDGVAPDPERLVELVREIDEEDQPVTQVTKNYATYGPNSAIIDSVGDNATFTFGGGGDDRPRRRS
ncbi:hypothetical protein [Streptomyces gardneri]|uniref:Uncharacterized protein n=1 Tax=Streptomyces gardneri TaxID=66892 RepID=A0A4Y3RJ60_9ACTN|nr:hypothetical protein [Streptomyces gardneri]GEB57722.1 hypothetical protein SGA01_33270 [Streptomyces gardneri]GHH02822.1 hypothetical protein GCM10017674_39910 [Streptomyces gardneri]